MLSMFADHFKYEDHQCPTPVDRREWVDSTNTVGATVECPLCTQTIPYKEADNLDELVGDHIAAGCPVVVYATKEATAQKPKRPRKCSRARCKTRELVAMYCRQCNKNYCVKHFHTNMHDCGRAAERQTSKGSSSVKVKG